MSDKERDLNNLLCLYETAIERQKHRIDKANKGRLQSTSVSNDVLKALVVADYKLLEDLRNGISNQLEESKKTSR